MFCIFNQGRSLLGKIMIIVETLLFNVSLEKAIKDKYSLDLRITYFYSISISDCLKYIVFIQISQDVDV